MSTNRTPKNHHSRKPRPTAPPAKAKRANVAPPPKAKRKNLQFAQITDLYRKHETTWHKGSFVAAVVFFLISYLAKRLPIFLYFPSVSFFPDSDTYFKTVQEIGSGAWPHFEIRPPAYPLFVKLIYTLHSSAAALCIYQSLISLLTGLFLLYALKKFFPSLVLFFGIAVSFFINSEYHVMYEGHFLTESLFVNTLLWVVGFVLLCLKTPGKPRNWLLLSLSVFFAILIKPAAMFLIPVMALLVLYALFNKFKRKMYYAFTVPLMAGFLLFSGYNYLVSGFFKLSAFGSANLLGATIWFHEPDSSYMQSVNKAIAQFSGPKADYNNLHKIGRYLENDSLFLAESDARFPGIDKRVVLEGVYKQIAFDAISKHPGTYWQMTLERFFLYFSYNYNYSQRNDFKNAIGYRAYLRLMATEEHDEFKSAMKREFHYQEPQPYPSFIKVSNNRVDFNIPESGILGFCDGYNATINKIFNPIAKHPKVLMVFLFASLALSFFMLIMSKGKNPLAMAILALTLMPVGKSALVALVELPLGRYAYTTSLVLYFSVLFTVILSVEVYRVSTKGRSKTALNT